MLFSLLLTTLLAQALVPQAPPPPPPGAESQAALALLEGREADALAIYQRIVAANPDDHQTRLRIASLHERMEHPDLAEAVYRSVLLEDPLNIPAMVGVATTTLARGETAEAIDLLERAERLAPANDAVLAALGRAHRQAGDTADAIGYLQRAVALAPTAQHRLALEGARRSYLHRVEARGFSEQFNGGTPNTGSGELILNVRLTDSLRVIGRGQVQRKFRIREERGGAGVEWRWRPATTLRAQALIGPDNRVLPEGDFVAAVDHVDGPAVWSASVRYFDFTGAWTSVTSPAVEWAATERLSLGLRYAVSVSESNAFAGRETNHNAHLHGAYRLYPRLWVTSGYARGVEDFESYSIDQVGIFRANTASGGLRLDLPTLTSLAGRYEHQWREGGITKGRVTVSLAQRF